LRNCSDAAIAKFTDAEQTEIRAYRSEARFVRAFSYWMVLDLYRQGPKVDETTPVTGYVPEAYDGIGLFDYVESELKALVAEGSSEALPDENEYGRAASRGMGLAGQGSSEQLVTGGEERSTIRK
jgi:hypothetical protein